MYGLYGVGLAADVLGGITNQTINLAPDVRNEPASGAVWPSVVHLAAQQPAANWTTQNLAQAFTLIPTTGLSIATLVGPPAGLALYAQQHADGSTRGGAATALKYLINKGLIVPRNLSCDHQQTAELTHDVLAAWDGTNDPVIKSEDATVPTAPADTEFTMGPIRLGGITIAKARNVTIDFGLNATTEGTDSDLWDRESRISVIQPTITVSGINPDWLKSTGGIPLTGLAGVHTNTSVFFRKRADGSTNVDDATPEHVQVTMAGLVVVDQAFSASGAALAEINIRMTGSYDGTNAPIIVTPNVAVT